MEFAQKRAFLVPVTEVQRVYSEVPLKHQCKENSLLFNKMTTMLL